VSAPSSSHSAVLAQFGLLCAIIVIMAFTPLGYVRIGMIEATLLMIPVAIGAIRLGPLAGGLLGAVFGLTSYAQCFGMSPFGTLLLGINPAHTFIVCVVPRVLMGIFVALIYRACTKVKHVHADEQGSPDAVVLPMRSDGFSMGMSFLASAVLNTAFFLAFFFLLFGSTEFVSELRGTTPVFTFLISFVGINGIAEAIVATVGGTVIATALNRATSI